MNACRGILLGLLLPSIAATAAEAPPETPLPAPPEALGLAPFYRKHLDAGGLPVVASHRVPDGALRAAAAILLRMTAGRDDVVRALTALRVRVAVMAKTEVTTDIPEHSDLKPKEYWDRRARGLGATVARPCISCAEENVLGYPDDRYRGESILVHEFAHTLHLGLRRVEPEFEDRLRAAFEGARQRGLWKDTYAGSNRSEYWAEGVQSYFDANRQAAQPDGVHNHVNTREELAEYDPELFRLIDAALRGNPWRWRPPERPAPAPGAPGARHPGAAIIAPLR